MVKEHGSDFHLNSARRFHKEIAAVLFFKLCAILILWELFFGPQHTVVVTSAKIDAALFTSPHTPPPSKPGS